MLNRSRWLLRQLTRNNASKSARLNSSASRKNRGSSLLFYLWPEVISRVEGRRRANPTAVFPRIHADATRNEQTDSSLFRWFFEIGESRANSLERRILRECRVLSWSKGYHSYDTRGGCGYNNMDRIRRLQFLRLRQCARGHKVSHGRFDGSIVMRISSQRWAGTDRRFLTKEDFRPPIETLVFGEKQDRNFLLLSKIIFP